MKLRQHQGYLKPLKCIGTGAGVAGAILIALNIGDVGTGYVLFMVSYPLGISNNEVRLQLPGVQRGHLPLDAGASRATRKTL